MNLDQIIAMSDSAGEFWTVVAIIVIILLLGVFVYTSDTNWFD